MVQNARIDDLKPWISSLGDGAIAVLSHKNGDMDTIGSATVLAAWIGSRARATGLHADKVSKRMLQRTGMEFRWMDHRHPTFPRTLAGIIAVDTGGPSQVGIEMPGDIPMFVIDHHASSSDQWPEDTMLLSSDASSTCQIILELILRDSGRIPLEWAEMLYAGIVTDTGRFKHGSENAHRSVVSLLDNSTLSPEDVLQTIDGDGMPSDQRKRILSSVSSMEIHHCGGMIVATAKGGSHESRIATSLVSSGADASIVTKHLEDGNIRITARASWRSIESGLDMGAIMSSLATAKGGHGGGHKGAAGWMGNANQGEAIAFLLAEIGVQARGD
tara:strand:+ start:5777 stop:6766 length:990 start_codon:yes stop_codon:yes gene_type:complete